MLVTLAFFIIGSAVGAARHLPGWETLPALPPVYLIGALGWLPALVRRIPRGVRRDRFRQPRRRAATSRQSRTRVERQRTARPADRTLAADMGRGRIGDRQFRDAGAGRAAVGHHLGLCAVGIEAVGARRRRCRPHGGTWASPARAKAATVRERFCRHHLGHGFGHQRSAPCSPQVSPGGFRRSGAFRCVVSRRPL